jgi:agmatinase
MPHECMDRTLWTTNSEVVLMDDGQGNTVLWHTRENWENPISHRVAEIVNLFAVPRTVGSAISSLQRRHARLTEADVSEVVDVLRKSSVLVAHQPTGILTPWGKGGMYGAPVLPLAELIRGDIADVVFVGVPYDAGVTHRPGTRFAPNYLRRASGAIYQYTDGPGGPPGMFDPVANARILQGVRLADAGDLVAVVFHRNGEAFDNLQILVEKLAVSGKRVVVMGGDHSLSLAVSRGLAGAVGRVGLIQIDAHSDLGAHEPGDWRTECHHGNFMNWVVQDSRIVSVVQIGIRQLSHETPVAHPKVKVWPGTTAAHRAIDELLASLPDDIGYHLSIDVDSLDPTVLSSTGTPLPGGFSHRELVALLSHLCRRRHIVGIDVMELIPGSTDCEGLVVSDLLLRAVAASVQQRS